MEAEAPRGRWGHVSEVPHHPGRKLNGPDLSGTVPDVDLCQSHGVSTYSVWL